MKAAITIEELKKQKRWVVWRLETRDSKATKVPYQISGGHAKSNDPTTWSTYAECEAVAHLWSGVGVMFGLVAGVQLSGVDLDKCYDPVSKTFTPESREIIIALDSYSELSPSGDGAHVLVIGDLRGRDGVKLPFPGTKAIEIYDGGRYFTFTGRHLTKTPSALMDRGDQLNALFDRVRAHSPAKTGLVVSVSRSEEDRYAKLIAGDLSDYDGDNSRADFALCIILAKKHDCNAFKMDAAFQASGLYREKWDRDDYRERTITEAIKAVAKETPVFAVNDDDAADEEDGGTEWLVEDDDGKDYNGWFPKGEVSIIGASSGMGKTSWMMPLLEKIRLGAEVFGHRVPKPRDYRVLLHDRSKAATKRTMKALHLTAEAMQRCVRLTSEQQSREPSEILRAAIEAHPGAEVWFIEGLDLWIPDMNNSAVVAKAIDGIQRVAAQYKVAVISSVGAPKQRGRDRYFGRDSLFGSQALGRKVETVVLMNLYDEKKLNGIRVCNVLTRTGKAEEMFFEFQDGGLVQVDEPADDRDGPPASQEQLRMVHFRVKSVAKPNEPIKYLPSFGVRSTYYRWLEWAIAEGRVIRSDKKCYLSPTEFDHGLKFAEAENG